MRPPPSPPAPERAQAAHHGPAAAAPLDPAARALALHPRHLPGHVRPSPAPARAGWTRCPALQGAAPPLPARRQERARLLLPPVPGTQRQPSPPHRHASAGTQHGRPFPGRSLCCSPQHGPLSFRVCQKKKQHVAAHHYKQQAGTRHGAAASHTARRACTAGAVCRPASPRIFSGKGWQQRHRRAQRRRRRAGCTGAQRRPCAHQLPPCGKLHQQRGG